MDEGLIPESGAGLALCCGGEEASGANCPCPGCTEFHPGSPLVVPSRVPRALFACRTGELCRAGGVQPPSFLPITSSGSDLFAFWRRKDHSPHPFPLSDSPNCYTALHGMRRWERKAKAKCTCKSCLQMTLLKTTFTQREENQCTNGH